MKLLIFHSDDNVQFWSRLNAAHSMAYFPVEHPTTCVCCCFAADVLGSLLLPSGTLLRAESIRLLKKGLSSLACRKPCFLQASCKEKKNTGQFILAGLVPLPALRSRQNLDQGKRSYSQRDELCKERRAVRRTEHEVEKPLCSSMAQFPFKTGILRKD